LDELNQNGVPGVLLKFIFYLLVRGDVATEPFIDTNECFAGEANLSRAWKDHDFTTRTFAITESAQQDMCSAEGFCIAVANILQTKIAGLNWFGIVCSSGIWLKRGTSQRTALSFVRLTY
jgi:hypothetical protein